MPSSRLRYEEDDVSRSSERLDMLSRQGEGDWHASRSPRYTHSWGIVPLCRCRLRAPWTHWGVHRQVVRGNGDRAEILVRFLCPSNLKFPWTLMWRTLRDVVRACACGNHGDNCSAKALGKALGGGGYAVRNCDAPKEMREDLGVLGSVMNCPHDR